MAISFDHYALKNNIKLLGIVCHISTDSTHVCMFLSLKRLVSEDYKTTKMEIIDTCRKFNLLESIKNIGFVADGALWNCVASKIPSIENDIELPVSNRCFSHSFHRISQE